MFFNELIDEDIFSIQSFTIKLTTEVSFDLSIDKSLDSPKIKL